jgi:carbamoyl-phosphate synthase large subunit
MKKGVNVIVSDLKIIENCQNKIKFSKYLKKFNILCPKIITKKNIKKNLPVIKKEVNGSASKNQEVIFKSSQININYEKKFFFQKFLKYQEYNLDILNDLNGNYLHSCAKKKLSIRSGETDKAEMINNKFFKNFAKKLSKALKHIGVVDVDFFYNKKKFYVLDINPRLGGGYPFTHLYGYDYIDKILFMIKNPNKKIFFSKSKKLSNIIFSKGISIYKHI